MKISDLDQREADIYARVASKDLRKTQRGDDMLRIAFADMSGSLSATLFSDHEDFERASDLTVGDVVKIRGHRGNYKGTPQLQIHRVRLLDERDDGKWDPDDVYGKGMAELQDVAAAKIVVDIETAPRVTLDSMPASIREQIDAIAKEREWPVDKVLSLNPLFSRVVSIAVGDATAPAGGHVLFAPLDGDVESMAQDAPDWLLVRREVDMLDQFWSLAAQAQLIVTFNGRNFDLPFLRNRSAILGVEVRCDLVSQPPYLHEPHLDLYQILTGSGFGARPMNLEAACWAFGIESPKGEMDGSGVAAAFAEKRYRDIADYNLLDIDATRELYKKLQSTVLDHLSK
ncbi:MAG: ribonuclease H-like domain-containing protein [Planctomycetes bacterium]|nr:ribonuclease H-like domain-containing protein [Planctomycetota bacterium]